MSYRKGDFLTENETNNSKKEVQGFINFELIEQCFLPYVDTNLMQKLCQNKLFTSNHFFAVKYVVLPGQVLFVTIFRTTKKYKNI